MFEIRLRPYFVLLLCLPALAAEPRLFVRGAYVMGAVATVKLYAPDEAAAQRHATAVFVELRRLEDIFTSYRDSELTQLNRDAASGPVALSPDMFELLRLAIGYGRKYDGAFDVTVGPAVRAWGFLGGPFRVPAPEERGRLRQMTGLDGLHLEAEHRTLTFARSGMEVDLGGIAKGYAAEKAARLLEAAGVERALVNLGESSYFALGPPPGRAGWPVAVLSPQPPHRALAVLELRPHDALSTSGTYGRSFRSNGRLYTHLFDPRNAEPVSLEASATVVCVSGAEAEAASKAVLLLRAERRRQLRGIRYLRLQVRGGRLVSERSPDLLSQ